MRVIVNGDDLGYTMGVTRGILAGYKEGILRSTTALMNAKYIEEARIGRVIWSSKRQEVTRDILELLENREDQQRMKDNMKNIKNHFINSSPL